MKTKKNEDKSIMTTKYTILYMENVVVVNQTSTMGVSALPGDVLFFEKRTFL